MFFCDEAGKWNGLITCFNNAEDIIFYKFQFRDGPFSLNFENLINQLNVLIEVFGLFGVLLENFVRIRIDILWCFSIWLFIRMFKFLN
jgi:hypothetical protein